MTAPTARHSGHSAGPLGRSRAAGLVLPALALFGAGCVIAQLSRMAGWSAWWLPLLVGSGIAAFLAWRRFPWVDGWSKYLGFGAVVLLACAVNRLFYLGDLVFGDNSYLDWPFVAPNPEANILAAEIATFVGTMLTVGAWVGAGGARFSPGMVLQSPRGPLVRLLGTTYVVSLFALVLAVVAPAVVQVSGQLLPTMLVLGASTGFFLPFLLARMAGARLALVVLMSLPFVYVSLGTGMKENVILALAPTGYMLWTHSYRRAWRVSLVGGALLLAALVTAYIGFFRNEVWYADRAADQSQVFSEFTGAIERDGLLPTASAGLFEFLQRSDAAPYRGWTMAVADSDGYQPGLVFAPITYVFVPRIVWPEKPAVRQGWEFSGLVFGPEYIAWSDSSLSAGLYPALYLGAGWPAVILGSLGLGLLMAGLGWLALRLGGPVLAGLFTLSLLPYALRLDESWTVGAFSGPIINLVYVALIFVAARALSGLLRVGRPGA